MSLTELSNVDIERYLARYRNFGGVIMKDEITNKSYDKLWIVNLESTWQGDGTHWTLVYPTSTNSLTFIDPFGCPPPDAVVQWMKRSNRQCFYSTVDLQSLNASSCGYWTIYIVMQLERGRSVNEIMSVFSSHVRENESLLRKYFRKHPS